MKPLGAGGQKQPLSRRAAGWKVLNLHKIIIHKHVSIQGSFYKDGLALLFASNGIGLLASVWRNRRDLPIYRKLQLHANAALRRSPRCISGHHEPRPK